MVDLPYPPGLLDSSAALPKKQQQQQYDGLRCRGVGNSIYPQKMSQIEDGALKGCFGNAKKGERGHRPVWMVRSFWGAHWKTNLFFCRKECCRYLSLPSNHHMVIFNQEHLLGAETSNLLYFQPENWEKMECNLTCAYFSNGSVETINYWGSPPWGGRSSIAARLAGVVWVSLPPRKKRGGFGNRFCLGYGIHNQEHGGKTTIQKGQNLWFDFFDSTCFCKKNWWGSIRYPLNLCQIRWFVRRINFKLHQVEGTKGCIQSFLHAPRFFFWIFQKTQDLQISNQLAFSFHRIFMLNFMVISMVFCLVVVF